MPTSSSISAARATRSALGAGSCTRSGSIIRLCTDSAWVERGQRILEHHLHPSAKLAQRLLLERGDVDAVQFHAAAGRLLQPKHRPAKRRLAAAGLAHQSVRPPAGNPQGDPVDGLDMAHGPVEEDPALDREVHLQVLNLQQVITLVECVETRLVEPRLVELVETQSVELVDLVRGFDRLNPPLAGFDRLNPPLAGFDRLNPPLAGFDRLNPPLAGFERLNPPLAGFERLNLTLAGFDRLNPPLAGFDRLNPPLAGFDRLYPPLAGFEGSTRLSPVSKGST